MDFGWSDEDEAFRRELRAFLAAHDLGPAPRGPDRLPWQRRWQAVLVDGGWAGPSWPKDVGGMDLPFSQQVVYHQEIARARVPGPPGTGVQIAGPAIIRHGTDEQRARLLPSLLRADSIWAQGFSEPGAGSDLPSLQTRARREDDAYVVTGQKVWSSHADIADTLFTLVRTGPPDSRQDGITYLILDLRSPGVTVRPTRDMAGDEGFSEIWLDEVVVPVGNRIGDEDDGWHVTRTSLGHERAAGALNQAANYRRIVDELLASASASGLAVGPMRQRLADIAAHVRLLELNAMRTDLRHHPQRRAGAGVVGVAAVQHHLRAGPARARDGPAGARVDPRPTVPREPRARAVDLGLPADAGVDDRRRHRGDPAQHRGGARARAPDVTDVSTTIEDHVATVVLDRPPVNAVTPATLAEIHDAFRALDEDKDVRVAIFTGAGRRAFMGGVDLRSMDEAPDPDAWAASRLLDRGRVARDAMQAIAECAVPVIGAINGPAIGAGLAFAAVCDVLIASDTATFGTTEINVGLLGASAHLSLLVGRHKARELFFSGELIGAAELERYGAVRAVVPPEELLPAARQFASTLASKSPIALRLAKESMNRVESLPLWEAYRTEQDYTARLLAFDDSLEARRAFLEKRDPRWRWR